MASTASSTEACPVTTITGRPGLDARRARSSRRSRCRRAGASRSRRGRTSRPRAAPWRRRRPSASRTRCPFARSPSARARRISGSSSTKSRWAGTFAPERRADDSRSGTHRGSPIAGSPSAIAGACGRVPIALRNGPHPGRPSTRSLPAGRPGRAAPPSACATGRGAAPRLGTMASPDVGSGGIAWRRRPPLGAGRVPGTTLAASDSDPPTIPLWSPPWHPVPSARRRRTVVPPTRPVPAPRARRRRRRGRVRRPGRALR